MKSKFFVSTQVITSQIFRDIISSNDVPQNCTPFLLFLENSSRTKESFKLAVQNCELSYSDVSYGTSSASKGEPFYITLQTLAAMSSNPLFIMRTPFGLSSILPLLPSNAYVINAGDGTCEHPTQAMIDIFTILQATGLDTQHLKDLTVTISGDILHSRVARSNILLMGNLGINVNLVAPATFMPYSMQSFYESLGCKIFYKLSKDLVSESDILMQLRPQKERQNEILKIHAKIFSLSEDLLGYIKKSAFIMHPGPVDGVELSHDVAYSHPQSLVQKQVANGPYVRTAIIKYLLKNG